MVTHNRLQPGTSARHAAFFWSGALEGLRAVAEGRPAPRSPIAFIVAS
jgi:hypothetical protein